MDNYEMDLQFGDTLYGDNMDPAYNGTFLEYDGHTEQSFMDLVRVYLEAGNNNETDFTKPFIKASLKYVYPLFVFLYGCVGLLGIIGNAAMLFVILRRQLYRNPMFFFMGNMALADIMKAGVVLPITLTNLLLENWIFGSFLCHFLPMLHDFPIHVSMLSYIMIAANRYRSIIHPMKSRIPAGLCTIALWVVSVGVVLPYAVYIHYIDMGTMLGKMFQGVGVCTVSIERNIEEYIRGMFVCFYCLPLAVIAFLCVRSSIELKTSYTPAISLHDHPSSNANPSEISSHSQVTLCENESSITRKNMSNNTEQLSNDISTVYTNSHEDDLNIAKERQTQKYIITMVVVFAICWCPIKILSLVTHFVSEDDDNTGHYDVTYLTFTLFGYISTCVNPILFAYWHLSDRTKNRLRGYFRFSNRQQDPNNGRERNMRSQ